MPAKVQTPEVKEFRLEELDARQGISDEDPTKISVRQATVRQNSDRSRLFSEIVREIPLNDGERERTIWRLPLYDLMEKEVFLTLVACNLTNGDKPLFRFKNSPQGPFLDMSLADFSKAWGLLDDETASEIHSKVLKVNPHWLMGANQEDVNLGEI